MIQKNRDNRSSKMSSDGGGGGSCGEKMEMFNVHISLSFHRMFEDEDFSEQKCCLDSQFGIIPGQLNKTFKRVVAAFPILTVGFRLNDSFKDFSFTKLNHIGVVVHDQQLSTLKP
ncbi:Hypothetical predicted protein [Octopus vulgaris]|uniref:Uncharacterized protein n=1 Tax=Octopus vulgaris TaxID=6645 RepID=A0AA36EZB6_OCTVU|nr:Hypothetical predicted protein [Octopus vulgaris]